MSHLLIVDDALAMRALLVDELGERGYEVETAASADEALGWLAERRFAAMVTDIHLGGTTGLQLTQEALRIDPTLPVIVITAFGSMDRAIEAIRIGAYDFITKPFEPEVLALSVQRAADLRRLRGEVATLRRRVGGAAAVSGLHGSSAAIERLENRLRAVAPTNATVLLLGESGAGKTRVARHVHELSARSRAPFVAENVAAIPEQLIESELFGHVRGAFTGATTARDGLLRRAGHGTLFLDEIGELPLHAQAKLLRALDDRRFRPVGSDSEHAFDARLVVATNRDLQEEVAAGRFREDLYYRLSVFEVLVPPLRARGRDVLELAARFLAEEAERLGQPCPTLEAAAARLLLEYRWPGNVRELHNAMAQAVIVAGAGPVSVQHLPDRISTAGRQPEDSPDAATATGAASAGDCDAPESLPSLAEVENAHIHRVLAACRGNKAQAARVLGLGRKTLYRKLDAE